MEAPTFNEARFLDLLGRLVALGPRLQNAPHVGLVPQEELAVDLVLGWLKPHLDRGFLQAERLASAAHPTRPSLILTLPGKGSGSVSVVGAHTDVVVADRQAEGWQRDPFVLAVEEGTLFGRGTTDCLGHVALLTELLLSLAERDQHPDRTLRVVIISNEESAPIPGLGLDYVAECGKLDVLQGGPLYWLDSADFGPTVGTGGVARWQLDVTGVSGHSGMPHNCVNALELAMAVSLDLGRWFAGTFPAHLDESRYGFGSPSSLKATVIAVDNRGITTIPGTARVEGDLRLTPFYDMAEVKQATAAFVADLGLRLEHGEVPAGYPRVRTQAGKAGTLAFGFVGGATSGLACDLNSPALAALERAIRAVRGSEAVRRFSITGALPLVRELQGRGFDIQITGFGQSSSYHAPNEQAKLQDFRDGFQILLRVILES